MATDFDEKLTTLSKKFHILDVGCIRDTLENCEGNVDVASAFLSSMVEPAEPEKPQMQSMMQDSDEDEELKRVLEMSQREEREKQAILESLEKPSANKEDPFKKADPPPDSPPNHSPPFQAPTPLQTSSSAPTISFAQQAKTGGNFQAAPSSNSNEPVPASQLRSQVEIKDGYNLYVMRGLPGSGKSTLAQSIVKSYNEAGKKGIICSADDFFMDNRGNYNFDPTRLSEAHEFCRQKADKFMKKCFEAVIIDNTNTEIWQMLPYAKMALSFRYRISIEEPNTVWKLNVRELARRNRHNVPQQRISIMKQSWEMCTTTELVKIARTTLMTGMQPRAPFAVPLQHPIVFSPGARLLGPPLGLPRHVTPRMPLRPMAPLNPQRLKTMSMNPAMPHSRMPIPSPPQSKVQPPVNPAAPNSNKPKFQMQANAVNVPDTVRESMAPPPADDPERFRCPPIADQEEALGRSRTVSKSNSNEELMNLNSRAASRNEEKLIPTDLLIEQESEETLVNDSEDSSSQQPIGFGRRNRNRNSSSHTHDDETEFPYSSSLADWNISGGLTKSASQSGVWSDQPLQKPPSNKSDVGVQTGEVPKTKSRVITATGDYEPAQGALFQGNSWNNMQDWSGQAVEGEIHEETSPGMIETLREMFPKLSVEQLRNTLSECCFNEERAIDSILSSLYMEDDVEEDDFDFNQDVIDSMNRSETSTPTSHDNNDEPFVIRRGEDLMEQLAKRFGKSTTNLSGEFHIPMKLAREIMEWWPSSSGDASPRGTEQELSDEQLALALQEAEMREQQEELEEREARNEEFPSLIPGQQPRQKPQGDWSTCDGKKGHFSTKLSLEKLQKLFPSMPKDRLEDYLRDNNYNYTTTVKTLALLFDKQFPTSSRQKTKSTSSSRPGSAEPHEPQFINHTRRYDENRKEAEFYRQKWEELKKRAMDAARRRDAAGGGEAAKLRDDAQHYYNLWQEAQKTAAERLFQKNNERFAGTSEANYFDFHGLHRDEAIKKLKQLLAEVTAQGHYSHVFIITGQGRHSKGNKAKLRKAVEAYLSQHDYKFNPHRDNPGLLKVFLRKK
ncbi:Oidioi.mRNA.OKI2018_I69.PAR.g10351.t1.cds [Oikopleura dioica]|uniref:Oidioi.mRNA.OKI2018_I69.PAR.g10351.t1.cds n=1 Tax=Oikopleura dioica TaxID=34765 RepID=A0ABN7RQD2_OIKDI|nr:Oidioi.mRNA.OKI2018_I69.PAR.g10351.t1.cds [Oikopleura dioica]